MTPLPAQLHVAIEWINGNPILDGSLYFIHKKECVDWCNKQKKIEGRKFTIITINKNQ